MSAYSSPVHFRLSFYQVQYTGVFGSSRPAEGHEHHTATPPHTAT